MNTEIILILAVWLGFLSFLMVILIAHGKHEKQNTPETRLVKEPLKTALVAFSVFFGLAVIAGYLFLTWCG